MSLCIIPARGGSKRIPRKNIKLFNGKPMIAYSILAAQESDCFKQIIVSTDDDEIAQVAREYGADVPFMRPAELSDDFATTGEVVRYTLQQLEKQEKLLEYVCCLYATAPFVQFTKLREGMQVLEDNSNIDFALAVTSFSFPPQRSLSINQAGFLEFNNQFNIMMQVNLCGVRKKPGVLIFLFINQKFILFVFLLTWCKILIMKRIGFALKLCGML